MTSMVFVLLEHLIIMVCNLTDGWMDRMDDGHTDGQSHFQVESHLGRLTDKSCD